MQVLPQGQHVDLMLAHALHHQEHLGIGLAQAEHQPGLGRYRWQALLEALHTYPLLGKAHRQEADVGAGMIRIAAAMRRLGSSLLDLSSPFDVVTRRSVSRPPILQAFLEDLDACASQPGSA